LLKPHIASQEVLVEVTPESIRIRKRILDHSSREVARKRAAAAV